MAKIEIGDVFGGLFVEKPYGSRSWTLQRWQAKNLLSFHPLAWTEVCAKQMQSLEANFEAFQSLNTVPLGLSVDFRSLQKSLGNEPRH